MRAASYNRLIPDALTPSFGRPSTNQCGLNANYLNSTTRLRATALYPRLLYRCTAAPLHRDPAKERWFSLLLPARLSRETPFQVIEISWISAGLRCPPPCILRKSPCISQKCREGGQPCLRTCHGLYCPAWSAPERKAVAVNHGSLGDRAGALSRRARVRDATRAARRRDRTHSPMADQTNQTKKAAKRLRHISFAAEFLPATS